MDVSTILTPTVNDPDRPSSCEYHRIVLPFGHMGIPLNRKAHRESILYFNRVSWRRPGQRFILDLDDHWILPDSNPFKAEWDRQGLPGVISANVREAMAVIVTNEQLADRVLPLNPNVHVVPNALPFDSGQFTRTDPDYGRLVYAGGRSHRNDIAMLDGLDVEIYGGLRGSVELPIWRYMEAYDRKGVSLVPLTDSTFNSCKSNLKVLEAGAKGLACICSNVLPYANETDRGEVILTDDIVGTVKKMSRKDLRVHALSLSHHVRRHYHLDRVNTLRREILEHYCKRG